MSQFITRKHPSSTSTIYSLLEDFHPNSPQAASLHRLILPSLASSTPLRTSFNPIPIGSWKWEQVRYSPWHILTVVSKQQVGLGFNMFKLGRIKHQLTGIHRSDLIPQFTHGLWSTGRLKLISTPPCIIIYSLVSLILKLTYNYKCTNKCGLCM